MFAVLPACNGADGISDIEGKVTRVGASEWSRGHASDIDGQNREVEWSVWEKRHRRSNCEGSSERLGEVASFKWAGAHESMRATSKFQSA